VALILLDTSVLIAFLDPSDDLHERARAALTAVADDEWAVPATVCAELLVGAFRAGDAAVGLVDSFLEDGIDRVHDITHAIARDAARIRAAHPRLSLADAFVLATGAFTDADAVLTADRAWARVNPAVRLI
jgi:predicted nucleic acid-binding protein